MSGNFGGLVSALRDATACRDRVAACRAVAGLLDARAPLGQDWMRIAELMR